MGWWQRTTQFCGDLLDTVPAVGHIKGVVHYAIGDTEGGNKAMLSATRSTAVIGAGAAGFIAGPAGALAAGAGIGAAFDVVTAAATNFENVQGIARVIDKPLEVNSWVGAGIDVGGDLLAGLGGGALINNIGKGAGKAVAKNTAKKLAIQLAPEVIQGAVLAKGIASVRNRQNQWTKSKSKWKAVANFNKAGAAQKKRRTAEQTGQTEKDPKSSGNSGDDPDRQQDKKTCQGSTRDDIRLEKIRKLIDIIERILDSMLKYPNVDLIPLDIISSLLGEFISCALPVLNDPEVRVTINMGFVEFSVPGTNQGRRNLVGTNRELTNFVSRGLRHLIENTNSPYRRQSCGRKNFSYCPKESNTAKTTAGLPTCTTSNVIYAFYCNECNRFTYVGQTIRMLYVRLGEHCNNDDGWINRHFQSAGHQGEPMSTFTVYVLWSGSNLEDVEMNSDTDEKQVRRNWEFFCSGLPEPVKFLEATVNVKR